MGVEGEAIEDSRPLGAWSAPVLVVVALLSVPFWAAAGKFGWAALSLPDRAGELARAEVAVASTFATGLAAGMVGAALALACSSARRRAFGVAATLLGITCITTGLVTDWYVEARVFGGSASEAVFLVPLVLLLCTMAALVNVFRTGGPDHDAPAEGLNEEQPQPLSPP